MFPKLLISLCKCGILFIFLFREENSLHLARIAELEKEKSTLENKCSDIKKVIFFKLNLFSFKLK